MKLAVTGAQGLLGWHLCAYARTLEGSEVKGGGREVFIRPDALENWVRGCDALLHFAGMNRGDDAEVAQTNVELARNLIAALEASGEAPHLLFASSTHIERDTAYGASKRECARLFADWAERSGTRFSEVVLPGVFGEGGKPFYNSVVSTFCHQIAQGETPTVHQDATLELIHAQDVACIFVGLVQQEHSGTMRVPGRFILVGALLERLVLLASTYAAGVLPDLRDPFDRDLFNTYRSYLSADHFPLPLTLHSDARGWLFEAVKTHHGGQTFLSSTHPGITRGNHYHTRKVERFLVVSGEAEIRLRRVLQDEVQVYRVSGKHPAVVDIPTLHTHNLTNVGEGELMTLFWTHELYNPDAPDTFFEAVEASPVAVQGP